MHNQLHTISFVRTITTCHQNWYVHNVGNMTGALNKLLCNPIAKLSCCVGLLDKVLAANAASGLWTSRIIWDLSMLVTHHFHSSPAGTVTVTTHPFNHHHYPPPPPTHMHSSPPLKHTPC